MRAAGEGEADGIVATGAVAERWAGRRGAVGVRWRCGGRGRGEERLGAEEAVRDFALLGPFEEMRGGGRGALEGRREGGGWREGVVLVVGVVVEVGTGPGRGVMVVDGIRAEAECRAPEAPGGEAGGWDCPGVGGEVRGGRGRERWERGGEVGGGEDGGGDWEGSVQVEVREQPRKRMRRAKGVRSGW